MGLHSHEKYSMSSTHAVRSVWILSGSMFFIFVLIAILASIELGANLNQWFLNLLLAGEDTPLPIGPSWLHEVGRDLTALGSNSVLLIALAMGTAWLALGRRWREFIVAWLVVVGGVAMSFVLKAMFNHPRPDMLAEPTEVFSSSFPSSHAMASAVTYLTLAFVLGSLSDKLGLRRYLLLCGLLLTVISGASRLYLSVHWPTDVLAGWVAGVLWLALCWLALNRFSPSLLELKHS